MSFRIRMDYEVRGTESKDLNGTSRRMRESNIVYRSIGIKAGTEENFVRYRSRGKMRLWVCNNLRRFFRNTQELV